MKLLLVLALALACGPAFASGTANAVGQSQSDSGSLAATGPITFEGSNVPDHTTGYVFSNPATVTPPSNFGWSPSNCGGSDSKTLATLIGSYGESVARPMFDCNVRQDATMAWKMGMHEVAVMRMFCFGSDLNRKAFEATGHVCPASATAKGIRDAQQGPAILATRPKVVHGTINPDGTVTWGKTK